MQYQIKWFVLFLGLFFTTQKTCCQVIQNGSHWWDGQRLYIAQTGDDGHILMQGESKDMGGDKFVLIPDGSSSGTQHYKLASAYEQGWIFIRGNAGWRVDYVCQENLHFLAVRNPTGDCVHLLTMTPDDLTTCLRRQRILEHRDVSWMLQNCLLDTHYLGHFSKPQIRLMRNEILARHGWRFQSTDLQEHFGNQPWYQPVADNNSIKLSLIELTNLQMLKSEEAVGDHNRVRYERSEENPTQWDSVDSVITVTNEEQFIKALGNYRTVQLGADVHLNLSRILEQEDKFCGVPGRAWVTVVERDHNDYPVIISEFCNDGQQLTLKHFQKLTIRGEQGASIEVDPRYAFCLNFIDCWECKIENLTIGHTEGGTCDGGVIGIVGGGYISISDCDLYGCGTYGLVTHETNQLKVSRSTMHHCTYGIMELYSSYGTKFEDCDFFDNKEFTLIGVSDSEETEFRNCRFYDNWPEAALFQSNQPIRLYNCEIYHPIIGSRDMLITPDNDCTFSDKAHFVPKPNANVNDNDNN